MSQMTLTSRVAATASGLLILGMSFVGLASATDVIARMAVANSSARVRRVFVLSLHFCGSKAGVAGQPEVRRGWWLYSWWQRLLDACA